MQEGRYHRIRAQFELLGHDARNADRVDDIRLARLALLRQVGFTCELKCITETCHILGTLLLLHFRE